MAVVQCFKIQFLQDNPSPYGGEFVQGDVLDIYIDTDTVSTVGSGLSTGISVNLNGNPLSPTGAILPLFSNVITVNNYNVQFCSGQYLISPFVFGPYPYVKYSPHQTNACALTPVVCDLNINGVPIVTKATGPTNPDGLITIDASSSNTIQYKIGADFIYGDGTSQTSNVFSGLLPGEYRIFLRDSNNCNQNILVTVEFEVLYGERFRFEYDDIQGNKTRILINKKSYIGEVSEVIGDGVAFDISLRGEGTENKFEPLLSIEGDCFLLSVTDSQFLEIYTNDIDLYRLEYYKDFGSGYTLLWTGKVLPQSYSEQYIHPPYSVKIIATDSLAELKDFFLVQKDGNKYDGTVSLIKLISYCLKQLNLGLSLRVAVNLFADAMDEDESPFYQAFIDYECFYIGKKETDLDFVVRSILEPFGARIVQWNNAWNITRVEELVSEYEYHEFNADGDYLMTSNYNPVKELDFPRNANDLFFVDRTQTIEMRPGYGSIQARYYLGLRSNFLLNGDFKLIKQYNELQGIYVFTPDTNYFNIVNGLDVTSIGYENIGENIDDNNIAITFGSNPNSSADRGEGYIESYPYLVKMGSADSIKISVVCKITSNKNVPYVKVRVRVKYGDLYLNSDGTWTSSENILNFFVSTYNSFTTVSIIAPQPNVGFPIDYLNGLDFQVRVYVANVFYSEFDTITDLENFATVSIPTGYKTEINDDDNNIYFYELEQTTSSPSGFNLVRPNDYDGSTNPRQWVKKSSHQISNTDASGGFSIDRIEAIFLYNGKQSFDNIVRIVNAEPVNKLKLEKEYYLGSYSRSLTTTLTIGFFAATTAQITIDTLSYERIYTGFLRSNDNIGYDLWHRLGIAESDRLHGIQLKSLSAQYKRSWRLLRCSFMARNYFNLIDVFREVNDSNRVYLPIGVTLNDKRCTYSGEFHELMDIYSNPGSDGSGEAPYNSAFSTGFGSSGFN